MSENIENMGQSVIGQEVLLKRGLQNRHIQMLALGGALGTGLFYGSAEAISIAGPSVLLSYLIGGLFIYFVLRMMGEMVTQEPVSGSFSHFANRYWCEFAGFISGWNYWFMFILVSVAEFTVIGIYLDHWVQIPHWQTAFVMLAVLTVLNLLAVRFFGEFEFWLSFVKVAAVVAMILFGAGLILFGHGGAGSSVSNLWAHQGFFPYGLGGMIMALSVIMFSFGGSELIGMTAAETKNPRAILPRAIRQYMIRLLLFYIGATLVILILSPWNAVDSNKGSPFVSVFDNIGIPAAGDILNIVVITAAVSVTNSGFYSNGRMLLSLAEQKNAPRIFARLNRGSVPYIGICFSALCVALGLALNYSLPGGAFMRILAVVTTAVALSWGLIILTQLCFRRSYKADFASGLRTEKLVFKVPFYPYSNYLCLGFLAVLFVLMLLTGFGSQGMIGRLFNLPPLISLPVPDVSISALILPVWIGALYIGYRLKKRKTS